MAPKYLWKLAIAFYELAKANSSKPLHIILKGQTDLKYSYSFTVLLIILLLEKMAVLVIYLYKTCCLLHELNCSSLQMHYLLSYTRLVNPGRISLQAYLNTRFTIQCCHPALEIKMYCSNFQTLHMLTGCYLINNLPPL